MRITNYMMKDLVLSNINKNLIKLKKIEEQRAYGKEINKPSDNPSKIIKVLELGSEIKNIEVYNKNIDDVIAHIETSDLALESVSNALSRINELLVSTGNGIYGEDERLAIKQEVDQLIGEIGQFLNSSIEDKFVFSGSEAYRRPIGIDPNDNSKLFIVDENNNEIDSSHADYPNIINKLSQSLQSNVSTGINIEYTINAPEIIEFTTSTGKNIKMFELLKNISDALASNDAVSINKLKTEYFDDINTMMKNTINLRSKAGSIQNRIEHMKSVNEEKLFSMNELLSYNQDINIAEKLIEYNEIQNVYLSTLQTGARLIQNSILEYLR